MLKECLEIFKSIPEDDRERSIVDGHIPADGLYLMVKFTGEGAVLEEPLEIKYDKKKKTTGLETLLQYSKFRQLDYYSRLIDMNKPVDSKKIIHSNSYLTFFIKKESLNNGKLTQEMIDNFYAVLEHPEKKYAKKAGEALYQLTEEQTGAVNIKQLENCRDWINEHIFSLEELGLAITGKDYLKIFFDFPKEEYQRECLRYLLPNIYNSNDYNQQIGKVLMGVPNDNMGLNDKKPYLEHLTRNVTVPYLLGMEDVLLQRKFFDYLSNFAASGKVNVYLNQKEIKIEAYENGELPEKDFKGIFLRLKKGKETEIHQYALISHYKGTLPRPFLLINYLDFDYSRIQREIPPYNNRIGIREKKKLQNITNEIFFSGQLLFHYFTEPGDINITDACLKENLLESRDVWFRWFYQDEITGLVQMIDKVSIALIKNQIKQSHIIKATHQFNLRYSYLDYWKKEGEKSMGDVLQEIKKTLKPKLDAKNTSQFDSDEEYYFGAGQMLRYLIQLNKSKEKKDSLANPFFNISNHAVLNDKLISLYKKYNYEISENDRRVHNLLAMIVSYVPEEAEKKLKQDTIVAGYLHSSLLFEKKEKEEKE